MSNPAPLPPPPKKRRGAREKKKKREQCAAGTATTTTPASAAVESSFTPAKTLERAAETAADKEEAPAAAGAGSFQMARTWEM